MQPYPANRDSGVDWLGKVPEHWDVRRLGTVADLRVSNVDKHVNEGEQPVRLCNYVDVYHNERISPDVPFMVGTARRREIQRFRLAVGDVLVTKDSEDWTDIGVPALVEYAADDLVCGYHLAMLRPNRAFLDGGYLFQALRDSRLAWQFQVAATGVTRYGLSHNAIRSMRIPLPPLSDQATIVHFLDHADRRIQCDIRAKERLIELLEEQKQAIIHQAVTGQIDVRTGQPYPAYKDSGVEWLGEVPEHWSVRRNRWLFRERNETGFGSLPVLEVSLHEGVGIRDMEGQRKQQMVDRNRYKRAKTNDIAYNTMRMWQGAVGVVPVDGLVSPAYVVMAPVERIESRYFGYLFRTEAFKNAVKKFSRGIVSDRDRLYWDGFKRIASFVPPLEEQTAIVHFLDDLAARTDRLAHATLKLMGWLTEWRESVISQVVTGKIDVREAAASLPEVSSLGADDIGRDPEGNVSVDPKAPDPAIQTPHP